MTNKVVQMLGRGLDAVKGAYRSVVDAVKEAVSSPAPVLGKGLQVVAVVAVVSIFTGSAFATDPTVTDIITGATTTFTAVAGLCVTMGVFFIGYRIAKRAR